AYIALDEQHRHLRLEKQKAELRFRELTDPAMEMRTGYRHFHRTADRISNDGAPPHAGEDPAVAVARKTLARATAEFEVMDKRREALAHRQNEARRLVTVAEKYLAEARNSLAPGATFAAFDGKMKKFASID